MSTSLILHPAIQGLLEAYGRQPVGSLLLYGPPAADLEEVVKYLLSQVYRQPFDTLQSADTLVLQNYSIEAVRQIIATLGVRHSRGEKPRFIIVLEVEKLSLEAVTAFLKILEEPPAGNHFILTSHQLQAVLPTVVSRCRLLAMRRPPQDLTRSHWSHLDETEWQKACLAADGWPSNLHAYLNDPTSVLHQEIDLARQFLSKDRLEKLKYLLLEGSNDKGQLLGKLIRGLCITTRASLMLAALNQQSDKVALYRKKLLTLYGLKNDFDKSLNSRLVSLGLALQT